MSYSYQEPKRRVYGALPEGDYQVVVVECGVPYESKSGKDVVGVKLSIQPGGQNVYYYPWTGETKDGEFRDNISEFLKAVNRAPKPGQDVDWNSVLGAKGKCRLKVEEFNGDPQNKVAFFYVPRETKGATTAPAPKATNEFEKARKSANPEVDEDNIPY